MRCVWVTVSLLLLACSESAGSGQSDSLTTDLAAADVAPSVGVTKVAPERGSAAGGITIVVRGEGFAPPIAVYFGDSKAKLKAWRPDAVSVISPPGIAGLVDVTVEAAGESVVVAEGFEYEKLALHYGVAGTEVFPAETVTGRQVLALDIEGDGDLDILQAVMGGANRLWVNNGQGAFADQSSLRLPHVFHKTVALAAADCNGDGYLDLIEGNELEPNVLLLGSAAGLFVAAEDGVIGEGPVATRALVVLDANGDEQRDLLIVVGGVDAHQEFYLNSVEGGLSASLDSAPGTWQFAARDAVAFDADGDGDTDLFFVGELAPSRLLLNDGDGVFGLASADALPAMDGLGELAGAAFDLEGDGDLDLILGRVTGDLILVNDGTGRFQERTELHLGGLPGSHRRMAAADMDLDGSTDLVLVEAKYGGLHLYRNDAAGHLFDYSGKLEAMNGALDFAHVAVGDLDGDMAPDIVASGGGSPTYLMLSSVPSAD